jgi:hypothetical protein
MLHEENGNGETPGQGGEEFLKCAWSSGGDPDEKEFRPHGW